MSAADGGRSQRHPIEEYLAGLRASLRVAPGQAELIVAEAEDHLRETAAAGVAAGMTELEAQEAAISAFGSVRAVVRAHQAEPGHLVKGRTAAAVLGDLVLAAWKLAGVGLIAVGASGLLVALMNTALGRPFTGQAPAGTRFSKGDCAYWMSLWPGARTCAAAHMLEASSDGVVLRVAAGIAGPAWSGRTPWSATCSGGAAAGRPSCWPATSRSWRPASSARAPSGWPSASSPVSRLRKVRAPI